MNDYKSSLSYYYDDTTCPYSSDNVPSIFGLIAAAVFPILLVGNLLLLLRKWKRGRIYGVVVFQEEYEEQEHKHLQQQQQLIQNARMQQEWRELLLWNRNDVLHIHNENHGNCAHLTSQMLLERSMQRACQWRKEMSERKCRKRRNRRRKCSLSRCSSKTGFLSLFLNYIKGGEEENDDDDDHGTFLIRPMVGQVGGRSAHKPPLFTPLSSSHKSKQEGESRCDGDQALPLLQDGEAHVVLKPLPNDSRCIREITVYEAIEAAKAMCATSPIQQPRQQQQYQQQQQDQQQHQQQIVQRLQWAWRAELDREIVALQQLSQFVPHYFGAVVPAVSVSSVSAFTLSPLPSSNNEESEKNDCCTNFNDIIKNRNFLILESLTASFVRPCVMDLKMGTETFEPDCSFEKRQRESSKFRLQTTLGFRIVAMRLYDPGHADADSDGFRFFSKEYGRSLADRKQVVDAFRTFFVSSCSTSCCSSSCHSSCSRIIIISDLLKKLRSLQHWFENQNAHFRFIASSLLICYEGNASQHLFQQCHDHHGEDTGKVDNYNSNIGAVNTVLKMIDLSHVRRISSSSTKSHTGLTNGEQEHGAPGGGGGGADEGYQIGLTNLISIFAQLLLTEKHDDERKKDRATVHRSTHHRYN